MELPITNPVLIFTIVITIILFVPFIFSKFKIPSIIGLIIAGIIIGPNGFNLLLRDSSIILFGTVGLLYIMFLAGLEIEIQEFKQNKHKSITFGILTFSIPMTIGTLTSYYLLNFNLVTSILLASMYASHTLLTYPLVNRMGISKIQVVNVTVGGTIITDTAALMILAIIASSVTDALDAVFWIRLVISSIIFFSIILYVFPLAIRWLFKNIEEPVAQFLLVLGTVFSAAFLAELAGLESIIGAFFAGLALNRLIPQNSPLMNRVQFVGNALFIPFFLLGVGMIVDYRVIFQIPEAMIVAAMMIIVATSAKWLAAFFTQKIFNYTVNERNLIFGLSNSQAAATLAAVTIGYKLGIFNDSVLNGTILMILVTCLISSFATEKSVKKLLKHENIIKETLPPVKQKILVPISHPNTIESLISLSMFIKDVNSDNPIYALTVVKEDSEHHLRVQEGHKMLENAIKYAAATEQSIQIITRIDVNIAHGIIRAAKELMITDIVIGWNAKRTATNFFFGSILDALTKSCSQMIMVSKLDHPLNTVDKTVVLIPEYSVLQVGFEKSLNTILNLSRNIGSDIHFLSDQKSLLTLQNLVKGKDKNLKTDFTIFNKFDDLKSVMSYLSSYSLLVIINARKGDVSYNKNLESIPDFLIDEMPGRSFLMIYSEELYSKNFQRKFIFDSTSVGDEIE